MSDNEKYNILYNALQNAVDMTFKYGIMMSSMQQVHILAEQLADDLEQAELKQLAEQAKNIGEAA